jgi:hypothetical protein
MANDARFDEPAGVLRLTEDLAERVLAPTLGGVAADLDEAQRAALGRAGLLPAGELHERLRDARVAAGVPLATVRVTRLGGEARGWLGADTLALTVHRGDGWAELICSPPDFFADTLVRLLDLGPRPAPSVAGSPWAATARCTVDVVPAPGGASADEPRSLDLLDTEDGWWRVRSEGEPAAMVPIGTADLWRELVRLAPTMTESRSDPAGPVLWHG